MEQDKTLTREVTEEEQFLLATAIDGYVMTIMSKITAINKCTIEQLDNGVSMIAWMGQLRGKFAPGQPMPEELKPLEEVIKKE
jgi:hypothetical protein